ncbi:cobaltochelatase CobT-related protein [Flexivirga sp.]|uniref:cobaltochelatase CobT-related protein n=1 Tax=Flexivirga sp. TaxID=1962927 RepID=UPI003F7CD94B
MAPDLDVAPAVALAERSAAAARALSGARLVRRGELLLTEHGSRPVAAAHVVTADLTDEDTSAGVADAVGARLRHSDAALHARLTPVPDIARMVFELAEQLRCESLVPRTLPGARRNLARLFDRWVATAWQTGAIETELGLHLLTVAVVLRSRLTATPIAEDLEDTIEATRFGLAERIGRPLRALPRLAADQEAFAQPALEIATAVAGRFPDDRSDVEQSVLREVGFVPLVPPGSDDDTNDDTAGGGTGAAAATARAIREYSVFSTDYDRESDGESLGRPDQLDRWRTALEQTPRPFPAGRVARIAAARLSHPVDEGWAGGTDEGLLDSARLGEFVARQDPTGIFRLPATRQRSDAAVTILLDCSGSMRRHCARTAALCDLLGHGLGLAGVPVGVLGFSTVDWHGGRAAQDWRNAGSPAHPGRLGGTHHLVFARPGATWRTARRGLPALLRPDLYAEGIDGEALQWAARLTRRQDAARRVLLVISDGGPMSTATRDAQGPAYLDQHLAAVADGIERDGDISLCALGIDADLSAFYRRSRTVAFGDRLSRESVHAALDLITE